MASTTTLNETIRTLDGTEWVRLATAGANWRCQISAIETFFSAALTSVNDTNVTITLGGSPSNAVLAATSLTMGWTGTLAVGRGGTGAGTFTTNGVLYGNTTSAIQVTAQGGANTILTANAGAPSFSAAPVIGTSVTCPLLIGGSAAGSTLTLESTSAAGSGDFVRILTGTQSEKMRVDSTGHILCGTTSFNWGATVTVGLGPSASAASLSVEGPGSGTSAGGYYVLMAAASTTMQLGHWSAIFGGAFDSTLAFAYEVGTLKVTKDGSAIAIQCDTTHQVYFPATSTTASAANAFIDNASSPVNHLLRSTSSLRYKANVTPVPQERIDALISLSPIEYNSLAQADDKDARFIGLAAEDVAMVDPQLVSYDAAGKPDGVMYDRVLLLQVAALRKEVEQLKVRLA